MAGLSWLVTMWTTGCGAQAQAARGAVDVPVSVARPAPASAPTPGASAGAMPSQGVVDSAVRAFNAHDAARLAALYAPDVTSVAPGPRGWREEVGRAPVENAAARLFAAFPDVTKTTVGVYASGDKVAQEWATRGTHSGEFMGVKATGSPVGFRAISIFKIGPNGQIASERTYFDPMTLALQIGLVRGPGRPPAAAIAAPPSPTRAHSAGERPAEARNEETVKAFFAWLDGQRSSDALATLLAPGAVFTRASSGEETAGIPAIVRSYEALFAIFPDATFSITDLIAADGYVVAEVSMRGTQRGAIAGVPPTNKTITLHRVDVFELQDSKITRACGYSSTLELRGQLDALPTLSLRPRPSGDVPTLSLRPRPSGDVPTLGGAS
jgi:steroid delta-isomerase-like uncharacterized protein